MTNELMEATDKATFLRWLAEESLVASLDDAEIHRICQRWIRHRIRQLGIAATTIGANWSDNR